MILTLQRQPQDGFSTPGQMDVDGVFSCYTLEPSSKADNPPIPAGKYPITLRPSPKFQVLAANDYWWQAYCNQMPHIEYKPASVTMIHVGNTPAQTDDCVLVGQGRAANLLTNSRAAFAALFIEIQAGIKNGGCWIEILEAPSNSESVRDAVNAEN